MTLSLDALKQQFADQDNKSNFSQTFSEWYPFWKMDFDQEATVRFLPDADPSAAHFLVEKFMHKLEITTGGQAQQRNIPCLSMYGKACPVCKAAKKFYDEDDETNGSRFYKKRSYLGQVIVVDSPFDYEDMEAQPKLISLNPKIYGTIKAGIMSGDVEALPTDYDVGYNFRIRKTRSGKWADYSTSAFAPRGSAVDKDFLSTLKLNNLKDRLPKEPSLDYVQAALTSALTGEEFVDPNPNSDAKSSTSGAYSASTSSTPEVEVASKAADTVTESAVVTATPVVEGAAEADNILKAIEDRKLAAQRSAEAE
jgi:hypothetical protein